MDTCPNPKSEVMDMDTGSDIYKIRELIRYFL